MEFNEKLQELRKQKGLTQEELAQALFVSRTAISKWESGRGYPSIDSLKAIAGFFCVSVDHLLSGDQVLTIAQQESKQKQSHFRDLTFGLMDLSIAMFFFLPLFGQQTQNSLQAVSLLGLTGIQTWLKVLFFVIVIGTILVGVLTLALQNYSIRHMSLLSVLCSTAGVFAFILSKQPYAATLALVFLIIKAFMLIKKQ